MQHEIDLQLRMQQTAIAHEIQEMPIAICEVLQRLRKYEIEFHFGSVLVLIVVRLIPRIIHHLRHSSVQAMKLRVILPSWFNWNPETR